MVGAKTEKMHQDGGCSGRGRDTLPVQVQMNKEAARPSVCTHTEPKTLVWTPQERNPNITPAPSTDTCGQCHSTDNRGAGGRDRRRASPRTTQTPKYPTASPNAGCGCRQHRIPSCRRHMPRQFPVRTHTPKIQNTLRPYKCYIFVRSPRWGTAREALTSVLSKIGSSLPLPEQLKSKKDAHTGVFFYGTILYPMCRCRYRTDLPRHRRRLAWD